MDLPLLSSAENKTIARILKVNHAGEHGAIRIYRAQIFIARILYSSIAEKLAEIRGHEIEHCRLFREAMPARAARPCRAMFLWGWGGFMLGAGTALLGPRMIWICTESVEAAVHRHLDDQLRYLENRDPELHGLIASIQGEELSHLHEARSNSGAMSRPRQLSLSLIGAITDLLIWLSTWGDSQRMARDLQERRKD